MQPVPSPTEHAIPTRRLLDGRDRTTALLLTVLSALCAAGFVVGPRALTGPAPTHGRSLSTATSRAFTAYWQSGRRGYPAAFADLVGYQRGYHLAKAAFALVLAILLGRLALVVWRAVLRAGRLRPATTATAAVSASTATALAFATVLAMLINVRGLLAPFGSVVGMLPIGHGDAALTTAATQISHDLATSATRRHAPPTLDAILDNYVRFHVVAVVLSAGLTVVLLALAVLTWRRCPTDGPAARRAKVMSRLLGAEFAVLALIVLVIFAANVSTVLNPIPGLKPFFDG
jgi:uncharacterized Tic20 family protein